MKIRCGMVIADTHGREGQAGVFVLHRRAFRKVVVAHFQETDG